MSKLLMIAAALILVSPAVSGKETSSYSATAFGLESGEVLYTERHVEKWSKGRLAEREVRYEGPDGELIAEKLVRYEETPEAPSFEMTDFRVGLREGAEVKAGEVILFSGYDKDATRRRSVDRPEDAVVDAGFDAFMRDNFSTIIAGEKLEFDFAVPAARRFFRFQLSPQGLVQYRGREALSVKMKPSNPLLRVLVDPIQLTYGLDGRLLEFRGLANVVDENGDRYKARIVFDYPTGTPGSDQVASAARSYSGGAAAFEPTKVSE